MFLFTYTFEREIKDSNTLKNVTDEIRHSFMEREMDDSTFDDNMIVGKEKLFKLDFSSRSPLVFLLVKSSSIIMKIQKFSPIKLKHFILFYFS